jgi:hypothetical protein
MGFPKHRREASHYSQLIATTGEYFLKYKFISIRVVANFLHRGGDLTFCLLL